MAQVESDLATLQSGRRSAAVMGFEGDMPQLTYMPASFDLPSPAAPESELLHEAEVHRSELLSQDHEMRSGERAEKATRKSAWPRVDLRAATMQYG